MSNKMWGGRFSEVPSEFVRNQGSNQALSIRH